MCNLRANQVDLSIEPPLCVDLDGTLVKTDILLESFFALIKHNFLYAFLVPLWLIRGKANLKQQIALRVDLDVKWLPYHQPFLDYLKDQHQRGRRLFLATASNGKFARKIGDYLGIFEGILASDDGTNIAGNTKLLRMQERFGEKGFDYAGNSRVDMQIWPHARRAILVTRLRRLHAAAAKSCAVERLFDDGPQRFGTYLRAMRLHQWAKNFLVFVPILTAHDFYSLSHLLRGALAFFVFGLCASSVYLLNDLLDLASDRQHPRKRERPLAAGTLPLLHATLLIPVLLIASLALALWLGPQFLMVLTLYYGLTLAYSLHLKSIVLIDVFVLSTLYTLRVIAGTVVIEVVPSSWLLCFSMFVFLSLAMVKRCSELTTMKKLEMEGLHGKDYHVSDMNCLYMMGTTSGYLSVLVLALFINSPEVAVHYEHREVLALLCPLILYWISRVWLKAGRGEMHDDPLVFTVKDRGSRYVIVASVMVVFLAL